MNHVYDSARSFQLLGPGNLNQGVPLRNDQKKCLDLLWALKGAKETKNKSSRYMGWVGIQGYLNPSQARIRSGDPLSRPYVHDPLPERFRSFLYCLASCIDLASILWEKRESKEVKLERNLGRLYSRRVSEEDLLSGR